MGKHIGFGLLLFALLVGVRPARAEDGGKRALELFQASEQAYQRGQFDEAARLLVEARSHKREPVLLYNLGRAYDSAGKKREAIRAFDEYLREDPGVKDGAGIRARIATLRREVEEADALASAKKTPPTTLAPTEPPRSTNAAPWIITGAGVLLVGGGVGLGVSARALHKEADAQRVQTSAVATQGQAESRATAATILIVAGGVIAGAGLTWSIVGLAGHRDHKVTAFAGPWGAGLRGVF